jgi:predicted RNA-binding Zn-ribbon protein involved in translation (DUF1610 family)
MSFSADDAMRIIGHRVAVDEVQQPHKCPNCGSDK